MSSRPFNKKKKFKQCTKGILYPNIHFQLVFDLKTHKTYPKNLNKPIYDI